MVVGFRLERGNWQWCGLQECERSGFGGGTVANADGDGTAGILGKCGVTERGRGRKNLGIFFIFELLLSIYKFFFTHGKHFCKIVSTVRAMSLF